MNRRFEAQRREPQNAPTTKPLEALEVFLIKFLVGYICV